jgi:hypothetical protein
MTVPSSQPRPPQRPRRRLRSPQSQPQRPHTNTTTINSALTPTNSLATQRVKTAMAAASGAAGKGDGGWDKRGLETQRLEPQVCSFLVIRYYYTNEFLKTATESTGNGLGY